MNIYAFLYESLMACCDRGEFRLGIPYTVAMVALGLGLCFNLLSVIDLLWTIRVLHNPYCRDGSLHPEHYVYALLYGGFVANAILARTKFRADCHYLSLMPETLPAPRMPGPAYVLGSAVLFVVTLALGVLTYR
jgi:hypothetical protein